MYLEFFFIYQRVLVNVLKSFSKMIMKNRRCNYEK